MTATRNPKLRRHFDDLFPELDQVLDAAEHAASVLEHPGMGVLRSILVAEIDTISRGLDDRVLQQAEYAMAHGRRGGLIASLEALDVLIAWAESLAAKERAKLNDTPVAVGG